VTATKKKEIDGLKIAVEVYRQGSKIVLAVRDDVAGFHDLGTLSVELKLAQLGISLVQQKVEQRAEDTIMPSDLLYIHFDLIRVDLKQHANGVQAIALTIFEASINCQLDDRVDASSRDQRHKEALGMELLQKEKQAVIVTNLAESDSQFLTLVLERAPSASGDLVLPRVDISVDSLEFTVDAGWLDPLTFFLAQSFPEVDGGTPYAQVDASAYRAITDGFEVPPLPTVLQVDKLTLSQISILAWCTLKLSSLSFLPTVWRHAIEVLSFSRELRLEGAPIVLKPKELQPHRGSMRDFITGLVTEYSSNFMQSIASVLGRSSLLNVPRAPIQLGGTAISYATDTVGLVVGEAGSLLNNLTLDREYVERQRKIRANKKISGMEKA
jgi:hypothetical protein